MATKTKTTKTPATKTKTSATELTAAQKLAAKFDSITPEQRATAAKVGAGVVVGGIIGALLAS